MPEPALSIRGLSKVYGNQFHALKGIDLDVPEGDFFALLGPNGAGKSTTLGIVCSLVNKTAGQVKVFGTDIDTNFSLAKYHLGVVPQEFNFNQFEKIYDIVLTQAGYYGIPMKEARPRARQLLEDLGLWDKRDDSANKNEGGAHLRQTGDRKPRHENKDASTRYREEKNTKVHWSGKGDSNSRPSPWQGDALPLSYSRMHNNYRSGVP